MKGKVKVVSLSEKHTVRKFNRTYINLIEGFGVEGDAHAGKTVKHRYLVKKDPDRINLRQAHIISEEIYRDLRTKGYDLNGGDMGENITTEGIDIMNLPVDTILRIGDSVELEVKGTREPCYLLNQIGAGLMKAVISKNGEGELIYKAGIMCIVLKGGMVLSDDPIEVVFPLEPHKKMTTV
jgi:hypothetical protein